MRNKVTKRIANLRQVDRLICRWLYTESPQEAKQISPLAVLWEPSGYGSIVLRTGYADEAFISPLSDFAPNMLLDFFKILNIYAPGVSTSSLVCIFIESFR